MTAPAVILEIKGRAAWLTINRPAQRNTLVPEVLALLAEHLDSIERDERARVVCLTGAGERAFCSGIDLNAVAESLEAAAPGWDFTGLLKRLLEFPKPLVARVNGDCTGGGLGLMLACDLIYAAREARFGTPEARLGLFPLIMAPLILRKLSRAQALEMFYTARLRSAAEAEAAGLITRACAAGELDQTVEAALEALAERSPTAFRIGRPALARAEEMPFGAAMDYLAQRLEELLRTEDAAEGVRAFLEKRPPQWRGR